MNNAAALEKNRIKLLRIVTCWLAAAYFLRCTRRLLPQRVSRFICAQLYKAEAATGYLIIAAGFGVKPRLADRMFIACAKMHHAGVLYKEVDNALAIWEVIQRLKSIRLALRRLAARVAKTVRPALVPTLHDALGFLRVRNVFRTCMAQNKPRYVPP